MADAAVQARRQVHEILKACDGNIPELRRQLTEFIDEQTPLLPEDAETEVQPTLGFQRVLQRAVFHVQSSGKKEVAASNVLVNMLLVVILPGIGLGLAADLVGARYDQ